MCSMRRSPTITTSGAYSSNRKGSHSGTFYKAANAQAASTVIFPRSSRTTSRRSFRGIRSSPMFFSLRERPKNTMTALQSGIQPSIIPRFLLPAVQMPRNPLLKNLRHGRSSDRLRKKFERTVQELDINELAKLSFTQKL